MKRTHKASSIHLSDPVVRLQTHTISFSLPPSMDPWIAPVFPFPVSLSFLGTASPLSSRPFMVRWIMVPGRFQRGIYPFDRMVRMDPSLRNPFLSNMSMGNMDNVFISIKHMRWSSDPFVSLPNRSITTRLSSLFPIRHRVWNPLIRFPMHPSTSSFYHPHRHGYFDRPTPRFRRETRHQSVQYVFLFP